MIQDSAVSRYPFVLEVVEYTFGITLYTHLYSLDDLHMLTGEIGLEELGILNLLEELFLFPEIYFAAIHADEDEVVLCRFKAVIADNDLYSGHGFAKD
jgi:hypothetical protein